MRVEDVHSTYRPQARHLQHVLAICRPCAASRFDIMPRENFGIVGESGCGKSTLTRLLAWLETPDQGDIVLSGVSLAHPVARAQLIAKRNEFQLLLQDPYNALPPRPPSAA